MELSSIPLYFAYFVITFMLVCAIGATVQERKAFRDVGLGLFGSLKVFTFVFVWQGLSLMAAIVQLPLVLVGKDTSVFSNTVLEYYIATCCFQVLNGPCVVNNKDKIPKPGTPPCVYVMNHQSTLDVCSSYFLARQMCWVAKKSVAVLPGVGQILVLSKHILLDRKGRASILQMFELSKQRLSKGSNIFIFPQGTRERTKTLPFKHGAFSIAEEAGCDIIPVSIKLSDKAWTRFYFYGMLWGFDEAKKDPAATLTVHDRIKWADYKDGKNGGKEGMTKEAFKRVYSCLPVLTEVEGMDAKKTQ